MTDAVVDLTSSLVALDSVNPSLVPGAAGEAAIARFLGQRLSRSGFKINYLGTKSRPSLIATYQGAAAGPTVVLNGHLDTVGVDGMNEPFTARIQEGRLIGRGTSDMKGGLAALVVAAETLVEEQVPGQLILAFVADEEDGSIGALQVLEHLRGRRIDVCLVAEPTWLNLAVAHRGFEVVRVSLIGRPSHSSQPELALDVVPSLIDLLMAVTQRNAELQTASAHPLLAHGTMMSTVVRAGSEPYTVASHAEVLIERRTLPTDPTGIAIAELTNLIQAISWHSPLVSSVEGLISRPAWEADNDGAAERLMTLLESALPGQAERTGAPYWMESALWQQAGVPTVVCGPAGGGLHALDEWVDIHQLQAFTSAVSVAVGGFLRGMGRTPER